MIGFIGHLEKQQNSTEFVESASRNSKTGKLYLSTNLNGLRRDITPNGCKYIVVLM
jgi:hypothetical protein